MNINGVQQYLLFYQTRITQLTCSCNQHIKNHTQALHQRREYIACQQYERTGYIFPNNFDFEIVITDVLGIF